jgi:hypothetical protein
MQLIPVIKYVDYTFSYDQHRMTVRGYLHDPDNRFFTDFELIHDPRRQDKPSLRFITFHNTPLTNEQIRTEYASAVGREAKGLVVNRILALMQEGAAKMAYEAIAA